MKAHDIRWSLLWLLLFSANIFAVSNTPATSSSLTISEFKADLASALIGKGSNLVGFQQNGAGAVARSVADKAKETVSIVDFGAIPNDGIDDSLAIQAAIDSSLNVHIPQGVFNVTQTIYLRRGLKLSGSTMMGTIIDGSTLETPIFSTQLNRYDVGWKNQGFRDGEIEDLKIVGNVASNKNHALDMEHGFHRSVIRRVWFFSCGGDAIHINADTGYGGYYNVIEQNVFGDPSDFSTGVDSSLIKGNGIYAVGSSNQNTVRENIFWRVKQNAIQLVGTSKWSIQRWTITDNGIENSGFYQAGEGFYGVRIDSFALAMNISRNYFEANGFYPPYLGAAIFANSTTVDLTVRDNLFASNPYAILLSNVNSAVIDGNSWVNQSTYFDIKVGLIANGLVTIGNNSSRSAIVGKYLTASVSAQPKIMGDVANAKLRGTTLLGGVFSPKLYGGSTEIACSEATGQFERIGSRLRIAYQFTVSDLNGAMEALGIAGSDGINLPMPGIGATIQYPFKQGAKPSLATNVTSITNFRTAKGNIKATAVVPKNGKNYVFLSEQEGAAINQSISAADLSVGSTIEGEFTIDLN